MTTWPILSVVTFLPALGALVIYVTRGEDEAAKRNSRWIALWTTLITFAVSLILVWRFDPAQPDFQFVEKAPWLANAIMYSRTRIVTDFQLAMMQNGISAVVRITNGSEMPSTPMW